MPPQQRLRNCAGRVWPKYRYVAWAAVGLKGFGRRQVAFVGPPKAVLFCELPALFYLHFPSHRLQFFVLSGFSAGGDVRQSVDLGSSRVVTGFRKVFGTSKAPGTVFLLILSPACVPTGLMW